MKKKILRKIEINVLREIEKKSCSGELNLGERIIVKK